MQVILLERIGRLGQMGDVVTVKDGYARNYLLPQGKALRATEANRKRFERERAQLEARDLELKSEAQAVTTKLDGTGLGLYIVGRRIRELGAEIRCESVPGQGTSFEVRLPSWSAPA